MKGPQTSRVVIADVAQQAGVSTATVDRVLNHRPGVRPATVQLVLKAAAQLGYLPQDDLYKALRPQPLRLAFILPAGTNRFLNMLGDYVDIAHEQFEPFNVQCRCRYVEGFNPQVLVDTLLREGRRVDGVAFMALEHPLVREAVNTLADKNVHAVTLISDLSSSRRAAYVGLDNRAAGRTAGLLLGRFIGPRSGKVAMIAGSRHYRGHEEREMGFQHILEEKFPSLQVVGLREGHDDAGTNYRQTRQLLEQHPELAGIYNIGGASDGVARALKEVGRDQSVVFVGHGLTPDTRALLVDGSMDALINQNLHSTIMNSVRIFANLREGREAMAGVEAMQISVVFNENLP
ncbi:LacI family DNA-binding transcriptional regulator [Pollutimonas thiosulfatoxidans]|uniref:LacI family transcriptional regulator n=1 Tax=Pollutimonas thiosulfatoxidans TaxID=2028345 RepID=A0A410GG66_9BURK|nr:LacI family DNA-binding transcriptional regulator [Pollutimonas thiosulfatoxidans]MBF6618065.1 LacI family DNA-binding transcriptional regulator [Candidimonas sp.]NYT45467.1 LacI family DNA-binding transcriptional regulator [Alcaligenaceae bacterium]QAA95259.1 LacI family transcriptional regulator [Pollutimonas thiosulfatoxidans]